MQKLRIALAALVTMVWLAGYVNSYVRATGQAPTELSYLMVFVLGWAFSGVAKDVIQRKLRELTAPEPNDQKDEDEDA